MEENLPLGFYGKVPTLGDFVSRRLPRSFIEPWDQWLQSSILASKEALGDDWLSVFLVSPIWRFALSPGICGTSAWAGIMMPCVDRVGRYFPLTLVQNIDIGQLPALFTQESDWFNQLENLALTVLNEDFNFDAFDNAVTTINVADHLPSLIYQATDSLQGDIINGKQAIRFDLDNLNHLSTIFPKLSHSLMAQVFNVYSIWACQNTDFTKASFLCCQGLPPFDAYSSFLRGDPQHPTWNLTSYALNNLSQTASTPINLSNPLHPFNPINQSITPIDIPPVVWFSSGKTVTGNRRKHNEDAMLDKPQHGIWVVADGMGGHHAGDVASRLIVDGLAEIDNDEHMGLQRDWVKSRLAKINTELCQFAQGIQEDCIVGSTVVVMVAKNYQCSVIWAGDSRLYQLRQGYFRQLTHDHTMVDELMEIEQISREQALQQVGANVITRAVGGHLQLELDEIEFTAEPGDRYLLCSDGLDKELSETEIQAVMQTGDCQAVVENLINQALDKNGRDNITAVVIEFC